MILINEYCFVVIYTYNARKSFFGILLFEWSFLLLYVFVLKSWEVSLTNSLETLHVVYIKLGSWNHRIDFCIVSGNYTYRFVPLNPSKLCNPPSPLFIIAQHHSRLGKVQLIFICMFYNFSFLRRMLFSFVVGPYRTLNICELIDCLKHVI